MSDALRGVHGVSEGWALVPTITAVTVGTSAHPTKTIPAAKRVPA
jgi:hypothetical protein